MNISIEFDVRTDANGKDPDRFSNTLKQYHKLLWSKELPNGGYFQLSDVSIDKYLTYEANGKIFELSSDSISNSYSQTKSLSNILKEVEPNLVKEFVDTGNTIGGYIIFPSNRVDDKMTINGARGFNRQIGDRFDLTLECIKRFYLNEPSPLFETFQRYSDYFELFSNFKGFVDFFLLNDLVNDQEETIKFFLEPFEIFSKSPYPQNVDEYILYQKNTLQFVRMRNQRILKFSNSK